MKKISKYSSPLLLLFVAIGLATTAAYFSVTGLGKLFAGAKEEVIIMASILELAKIVCASWLHKNWVDKTISKLLKIYLTIGVFLLMCLTSAGIYGFLSSAYFDTSNKLGKIDTEISLLDKQKIIYDSKIVSLNQVKKSKSDRIQTLTDLRMQQESRIDSLYKKMMSSAARRTEGQIKEASNEINVLLSEIDKIDGIIQIQNDSITKIELKKADLGNSDIAAEIGPLKYIAKISNTPMDNVINWFILAIIFVFDPLAISILIASNKSMEKVSKYFEEQEGVVNNTKVDVDANVVVEEEIKLDEVLEEKQNIEEEIVIEESLEKVENDIDSVTVSEVVEENTINKENDDKIEIPKSVYEYFENKKESEEEFKKRIEQLNIEKENINKEDGFTASDLQDDVNTVEKDTNISDEEYAEIGSLPEKIKAIEEKEERDTLYLNLLTILFKGGTIKKGDEIPSYKEFLNNVRNTDLKYTEKLLRDFLTTCNLVKVIDTSDSKRIAMKTFEKAKEIIQEI